MLWCEKKVTHPLEVIKKKSIIRQDTGGSNESISGDTFVFYEIN